MTPTAAPPLSSTERPRFVAPAFDVVVFRQHPVGVGIALLRAAVGIAAIAVLATSAFRWSGVHVLVGFCAAVTLMQAVHEATTRIEISGRGIRFRSTLSSKEFDWRDVAEIHTHSELPKRERSPSAAYVTTFLFGVAGVLWLFIENPVLELGLKAFPVIGTTMLAVQSLTSWAFLRHSRNMATVWIVDHRARLTPMRILIDPRPMVSLKRHLRRCALEHGIDPPW